VSAGACAYLNQDKILQQSFELLMRSLLLLLVLVNVASLKPVIVSRSTRSSRPLRLSERDSVETSIAFLNQPAQQPLLKILTRGDPTLEQEMDKANFWTASNFVIKSVNCLGVVEAGLKLSLDCEIRDKPEKRTVTAPFPFPVLDDVMLKRALVQMAINAKRLEDTGRIVSLEFGEQCVLPLDFRFNDVPHAAWVRAYIYDMAANAFAQAINDPSIPNKSRLQMHVNVPEVNPAFDTYRIGTMLEMVRRMALTAAYQGKNVRICVQQALGEGIFVGLPLALSSMRFVLEKMDWGTRLDANAPADGQRRIRFGEVGKHVLAEDDDVCIVIAPQNVVGAEVTGLLEEMVVSAQGRYVCICTLCVAVYLQSNKVTIHCRRCNYTCIGRWCW
jgi:hypothetical protein